MNYNPKVSDYISNAPEEQIEILELLRSLIHKNVPGVKEEIKWRMPVFAQEKNFAYIQSSKKHVTLGFYHIEQLKDPDNLLEGSGNTLRHIKIKSKTAIHQKQITTWLKAITSKN